MNSYMHWRAQLTQLEQYGDIDIAVFLLQKVISENPNDADAYIALLYTLMDTIVEGPCYWSNVSQDPLRTIKAMYYQAKESEYRELGTRYLEISYKKFSTNPEYLYIVGCTLIMEPWSFGVNDNFRDALWRRAHDLDPDNPLYQKEYYYNLSQQNPTTEQIAEIVNWAQRMQGTQSPLLQWDGKGRAWTYAQNMINWFVRECLQKYQQE